MRTLLASHLTKNISKTAKSTCSFPAHSCYPAIFGSGEQCLDLTDDNSAYFFYPPVNVEDTNGAKTEEVYIIFRTDRLACQSGFGTNEFPFHHLR